MFKIQELKNKINILTERISTLKNNHNGSLIQTLVPIVG